MILERLKSRKFWLTLLAMVLVWFGVQDDSETALTMKLAVEAVLAAVYVLAQASVDKEKERQNGKAKSKPDPVG